MRIAMRTKSLSECPCSYIAAPYIHPHCNHATNTPAIKHPHPHHLTTENNLAAIATRIL